MRTSAGDYHERLSAVHRCTERAIGAIADARYHTRRGDMVAAELAESHAATQARLAAELVFWLPGGDRYTRDGR